MSGRPYTVSELKTIVDYLVENKLYSETRARKMWVDFANTKITNRTWQSLKETFLKRILPDIHNPYFKLTNEQISSFRARCDLADKDKNKLEIHTISDDSSSNGNNPKDIEPSNDEGETNAGENTCSKIPLRNRSSADTVILEHCYETVEDIQRDLESTEEKIQDLNQSIVNKSLRDCITYSEPLTPMLQEVLDDFASEPEDSDRENKMEIVESESVPEAENVEDIEIIHEQVPDFDNDNATTKSAEAEGTENDIGVETVEELLDQEIDSESCLDRPLNTNSNTADDSEPDLPEVVLDEEISSMQAETHTDKNIDDSSELIDSVSVEKEVAQPHTTNTGDTTSKNLHPEPQLQSGAINTSNSTVDASLPNNPEAFKNKQSKNVEVNKNTQESTSVVSNVNDQTQIAGKATRKRSVSEEQCNYTHKKKKRLHIQLKSSSESEGKTTKESHKGVNEEDKLPKVNGDATKVQAVKMGRSKNTDDYSKPSTSTAICDDNIIEIEDATTELPPVIINPCLQTVSLFDEQFNKTRHNSSESSDSEKSKKEKEVEVEKPKPDQTGAKISKDAQKSRSDSDTVTTPVPPKKKRRVGVISSKSERDKAISNMFGVTSGGGTHSKRKRRVSHRARTTSHNTSQQNAARSDSSNWTSESESDAYVSPPRGRRNRPTKKYLKPRSAKISSLEEEGGLFVMYGKRIYPVIKDGKIIKNYVTFLPESDSDEELFWKQKYVEEKKKAAELKKLLEEATEPKPKPMENNTAVQQPNPISTPRPSLVQVAEPSNGLAKDVPSPKLEEKKEVPQVGAPEKIKIKFTKNNEEVHLEGHWPQIHPVLEQVVHIFHKESETAVSEPPQKPAAINGAKELSSGSSTPIVVTVDPEVHEKVNKIEKEIFQEIEERDQEDRKTNGVNNVTKRKQPAQKKSSSSSIPTPEKQPKISNGTDKQTKETVENGRPRRQKAKETENKSIDNQEISPKRQIKTPRKVLNETVNTNNLKTVQTRQSKQNLDTSNPKEQEEEEVKYMLATRSKRLSLKTANNKTNKKTYKSSEKLPRIFSSPDNLQTYSMDSTQGYQESDASQSKPEIRKKKKLDMSSFVIKTRNSLRRNSKSQTYPYLYCDAYNDSSNSSVDAPATVARENSTLKSDAYRSESYQLLMPQVKIVLSRYLEPIHETSPSENRTYFSKSSKEMSTKDLSAPKTDNHTNNSGQMTSDVGSSSNMSLPMSPELSIVENLSISKEILNSADDYPTIHEMQNADTNKPITCNNYRISEVNVTLPLMNQECDFEGYNSSNQANGGGQGLVTESLLNKIDTFNINDQVTPTDTLNKKLHDLLLESAKKASRKQSTENKDSVMDVDVTSGPSGDVQKKAKAKKRCSTPQKRKGSKKSVAPQVDPVVEEEHVESFSHGGRQSCPPLFQAYLGDEVITAEINTANLTIANEKPKGRKKKDIIRVKIQRPKHKPGHEKVRSKSAKNASKLSVFTDSGINETESEVFQHVNESVELIHNHSETCLLANECVGDSLEFVENSKSVITLDDSLQSGDAWNSQTRNTDGDSTSPSADFFCNNAQDVSMYKNAKTDIDSVSETVYHSPYGTPNSLITEDISDDSPLASRPAKWYLLSEDETNNTNLVGQGSAMLSAGSYASNLKHIFPVTCAVPDLSTITEMSDSSRKPALEDLAGLTGDDFNSLSVFDSNFNV